MNKSAFAKVFGWLGAAALSLSQAGFHIGHIGNTDILGLLGLIAVALGVHGASSTNGQN